MRLPFWNTLIVALGPNVGVIVSGQLPGLVHTFVNVIYPPLGGIGPDWPLARPPG